MSPALITFLESLAQFVLAHGPEIYVDIKAAVDAIISGKDPTADQQAAIDAALDKANNVLQTAVTAQDVTPAA